MLRLVATAIAMVVDAATAESLLELASLLVCPPKNLQRGMVRSAHCCAVAMYIVALAVWAYC